MYRLSFFYLLILFVMIQTVTAEKMLSGKVIDKSGTPIEGAIITLQSTGQTVTTPVDGTFGFETLASLKNQSGHFKSNLRMHNGMLFMHNTGFKNVLVDLFDLNGRQVSVLQNGKLEPGFYQFTVPETGNQTLLLRARIGSVQQVYKLIGKANLTPFKKPSSFSGNILFADAQVADTLVVTHSKYDDIVFSVNNFQEPVTVQMLHGKMSFKELNTMKVGDTLWNSANQLRVSFDELIDTRCPCEVFCAIPSNVKVLINFQVKNQPCPVEFTLPGKEDTTVAGIKIVLHKVYPECPAQSGSFNDHTISVGIAKADSFPKVVFLNYTKHEFYEFDSDTCIVTPCLPMPTFNFSEDKILSGSFSAVNDSIKVIFGDGLYINFNGKDVGARNLLIATESIPWAAMTDLSIDSLGNDGTVRINWRSQLLTLRPGQNKIINRERIDTIGECTIKINITDSLTNYGILYPWQIQPEGE